MLNVDGSLRRYRLSRRVLFLPMDAQQNSTPTGRKYPVKCTTIIFEKHVREVWNHRKAYPSGMFTTFPSGQQSTI